MLRVSGAVRARSYRVRRGSRGLLFVAALCAVFAAKPGQRSGPSCVESVKLLLAQLVVATQCSALGMQSLRRADTPHAVTLLNPLDFCHWDERATALHDALDVPSATPGFDRVDGAHPQQLGCLCCGQQAVLVDILQGSLEHPHRLRDVALFRRFQRMRQCLPKLGYSHTISPRTITWTVHV